MVYIVFGLIFIGLVSLMLLYIFLRAAAIPLIVKYLSLPSWLILGFCLWTLVVVGWKFGHKNTGNAAAIAESVGMNAIGLIFIMFSAMLLVDVITGFGFFFKQYVPALRGVALIAGLAMAVFANIQAIRQPVLTTYNLKISNLSPELDGIKIIALSDIHLGKLIKPSWFSKVVETVNFKKPDIIVLVGDIIEGREPLLESHLDLINKLKAPMGVWAVVGNHDDNYIAKGIFPIEQTNVNFLYNENKEIAPKLNIAGIEDLSFGQRSLNPIDKTFQNLKEGTTIFLSHAPVKYVEAAQKGVDIMISGHTHAGQIWPFGYLVKTRYNLYKGKYDINDMALIVSRGTGTWGPRMRLWERGEIVEIMLHRADN
ncbi:MAG: metallophosphoesterase [Alphaproteobacteria bacterium]